ncbi:MAG: ribonuclease catalytic domain-containing protein [Anaerolineales bacterium]
METDIKANSLALYRGKPARVIDTGEKLAIELEDGEQVRVRFKDLELLHPGPLSDFKTLKILPPGELELAWQILLEEGEQAQTITDLTLLAELTYGEYSPATALAAYRHLEDGLYFEGSISEIKPKQPDEVRREIESRRMKLAETRDWQNFIERIQSGKPLIDGDKDFLMPLENLAYGRVKRARLLAELGRSQTPRSAHALLLELGYWDNMVNPHPVRLGLSTSAAEAALPATLQEERLDLTGLESYAIDDPGAADPDDALSLESIKLEGGRFKSGRIWVHVADAAGLVQAGSAADLEARGRGSTLYLPEGTAPMLPTGAVERLGLGLGEISPALSFLCSLNAEAEIIDLEIHPSLVRVKRISYQEAETQLTNEPFRSLALITDAYRRRRAENNALFIDLPEVKIRVEDGEVQIKPLPELSSRDMVREAMLMAGEAAAGFALENGLPFPYATQDPPDPEVAAAIFHGRDIEAGSPAYFYALRRISQRSQVSSRPGPHSSLGLTYYSRVTSPMRRYLDLVAHQQLRAFTGSGKLIEENEMLERLGAAEAVTGSVVQAERLSRRHWTLVYLIQHPGWNGEGVLVDKRDRTGTILIPGLAFETRIHLKDELEFNTIVKLACKEVNLPELEAYFQIL